jgi:mersacidin/lichenicidin family type 2 lantibiotic
MKLDIVRAWKDATYRAGLSTGEREMLPSHPAGLVELSDEQLKEAAGVAARALTTCQCCTDTTRFRRCCP